MPSKSRIKPFWSTYFKKALLKKVLKMQVLWSKSSSKTDHLLPRPFGKDNRSLRNVTRGLICSSHGNNTNFEFSPRRRTKRGPNLHKQWRKTNQCVDFYFLRPQRPNGALRGWYYNPDLRPTQRWQIDWNVVSSSKLIHFLRLQKL